MSLILTLNKSAAFNPNFDGNALAWYDGNAGLTNLQWNDQGAGGHDIIFANLPTIVANATPLRDAVRFNGINQSGNVATPPVNQPYTQYIVIKQITWTLGDRTVDGGVTATTRILRQAPITPDLEFYSGASLFTSPNLAIGNYGVITMLGNGVNSELRTNLNVSVSGNAGLINNAGIELARRTGATSYANVEIGYIIIRTGADSTVIQNRIINGLKVACGLTF